MNQDLIKEFENKKILILGFGREGKSTYNFILNNVKYKELAIADKNQIDLDNKNIKVFSGEDYLECINKYDMVLKTPGISINYNEYKDVRITSQTEMFLKFFRYKTIGVTGTKGKSTTATLMQHVLTVANKKSELIGNIGFPAFNFLDQEEKIDYFVYELSAHQLENCRYSPNISIFLNIFEEHLDHFGTFEKYLLAKQNIFLNQSEKDLCIYNFEMKESILGNFNIKSQKVPVIFSNKKELNIDYTNIKGYKVTSNLKEKKMVLNFPYKKCKLKGKHNINNFMFILTVSNYLKLDKDVIKKAILTFEPLEHRMQDIGVYNKVRYINDSISTIPKATISAIETIKNVETVLIGGMDRGIDYTQLTNYLKMSKVKNVILMYETGNKMKETLKDIKDKNIIYVEGLEDAVKMAAKFTNKNKTCLLSPAAASYGHFLNFEERGKMFKEYVVKYN